MSSSLLALRGLGVEAFAGGLELKSCANLQGLRGLYSTKDRAPSSPILVVPFSRCLTPSAPGGRGWRQASTLALRQARESASRAGRRVYTEEPRKAVISLTSQEQSSAFLLAIAQTELVAKRELVNRGTLSKSQFETQLTPLQRYAALLPTEREPKLPHSNSSPITPAPFDDLEDDYFFCLHSGVDALAANLMDTIGQSPEKSKVASAIYESGAGEELLLPICKWAISQSRSRALWYSTPNKAPGQYRADGSQVRGSSESNKGTSTTSRGEFPIWAPGIDFVNHYYGISRTPNARVRLDSSRQAVVLEVLPELGRSLKAGEQITVRYLTPNNRTMRSLDEEDVHDGIAPNTEMSAIRGYATPKWQWQLTYGFVPTNVRH